MSFQGTGRWRGRANRSSEREEVAGCWGFVARQLGSEGKRVPPWALPMAVGGVEK